MWWQLFGEYDWNLPHLGTIEKAEMWMRQKTGVSVGPQWAIAQAIVSRLMHNKAIRPLTLMEPQHIIPQHRWLEAVEGLNLPGLSQIAGVVSQPFDMYLRAVYGDEVANWQKREAEKYIVDMGYNPQDLENLPKSVIQDAWKRYHTRQLLSIPAGAVKYWTDTERAYWEATSEKMKEMGLTKAQITEFREAGISPFVGLRQDQLEAIYEDVYAKVPKARYLRYVRPVALSQTTAPAWEDYIRLRIERETLRGDPKDPLPGSRLYKERIIDNQLKKGLISPREWKLKRRQMYSEYIYAVEQAEKDYPLAMKSPEDWEAFRQLLGWKTPVRHPDDQMLDLFYRSIDPQNFEDDIGTLDYDAYRKAEQDFYKGILPNGTTFTPPSPDAISYIQSRRSRYKTPMELIYQRDMELTQAYWDIEDMILSHISPDLAAYIKQALAAPDSAIQKVMLQRNLQALMIIRAIRQAKETYRRNNPQVDKVLRYWSS